MQVVVRKNARDFDGLHILSVYLLYNEDLLFCYKKTVFLNMKDFFLLAERIISDTIGVLES